MIHDRSLFFDFVIIFDTFVKKIKKNFIFFDYEIVKLFCHILNDDRAMRIHKMFYVFDCQFNFFFQFQINDCFLFVIFDDFLINANDIYVMM